LRLKAATFLLAPLMLLAASDLRAEYIVLRSGQRLHVTGYQLLGDKYRLQMAGGWVEASAQDVVAIEPEDSFASIPAPPQPPAGTSLQDLVAAAASRFGVDAELITSVIAVESNFDPKAISPKNARGLMQLLPETAARLGVKNVFDPKENIEAGTRYLRELLETYHNNLTLALAAYNAGPDRVQQYGDVPPFRETVSYVRRVQRTYEKNKSTAAAAPPATSGSNSPALAALADLTAAKTPAPPSTIGPSAAARVASPPNTAASPNGSATAPPAQNAAILNNAATAPAAPNTSTSATAAPPKAQNQ
jgi:Transglycosylase SLT domain